jgi:hypothetical protein
MRDQDEQAIIRLLNLYGLVVDTRRWDLLDTVFSSGCVMEYPKMKWDGLNVFKASFTPAMERYSATQHSVMNHLVDVAGDTAKAFSHCFWRLILEGTEGGDFIEGMAWYDDSLVRTGDRWQITRRACRTFWTAGNPRVMGTSQLLPGDKVHMEAADGKVGFLAAYDARHK